MVFEAHDAGIAQDPDLDNHDSSAAEALAAKLLLCRACLDRIAAYGDRHFEVPLSGVTWSHVADAERLRQRLEEAEAATDNPARTKG